MHPTDFNLFARDFDIDISNAPIQVAYNDTQVELRDWVRFTASPAWAELKHDIEEQLTAINNTWPEVVDLQRLGRLAGRREALERILHYPDSIIQQLKAQESEAITEGDE